jgi:hypothetical protein
MTHDPAAEPHQINLSSLFWCVAFGLAAVELRAQAAS